MSPNRTVEYDLEVQNYTESKGITALLEDHQPVW